MMSASYGGHVVARPVPVVLDTDGAPDDLRAICVLLAGGCADVLAITTSGGSVSAETALRKVRALLHDLGQYDIPSASGPELVGDPPPWRSFAEQVNWGEKIADAKRASNKPSSPDEASALIGAALAGSAEKVTLVCLGSLANAAGVLEAKPELEKRIERVIWYNDEIDPLQGTNYSFDPKAAEKVFATAIRIDVVSNIGEDAPAFDSFFLEKISDIDNAYTRRMVASHYQEEAFALVERGHFKLWDDLVPVYMLRPLLFVIDTVSTDPARSIVRSFDEDQVRMEILNMLDRHHDDNVTLADFPIEPDQFKDDLGPYVERIIQRHGHEEWRLAIIASEMHQHLGIYSVVGVKMGLRAREIMGVGLDELEVTSYAGTKPPVSCMNDGLQVSTGATLGHGMITVAADSDTRPAASFEYGEGSVTLTLKDEYWAKIREAIEDVQSTGTEETYFTDLRKAAITFWLEWDRNQIFEVDHGD
jgi:pyrimidine-specific ribonucleoside hydrolase